MQFGGYILQKEPYPALETKWREAEDAGLDHIWVADHIHAHESTSLPWYDGWTTLTAMAMRTTKIRVGSLISSPVLRQPAVLAKMAAAVDDLSNGRLELGIGTGITRFDHEATGTPFWPMTERVALFREYAELISNLLSNAPEPVTFRGDHYTSTGLGIAPPTVQRPRPPITIAGQSPAVLEIAAAYGDRWNTNGPIGKPEAEILELTRNQNLKLDELCDNAGRDPRSLRRSLLMLGNIDPWADVGAFERIVTNFAEIGIQDFIFFWPKNDQRGLFERALTTITSFQ
jgi:alkanesulfonate monooxygenase SsuD/methylene tetrahydromethanopterin reductase-like flavin-dependent oxidoreductase (luciferase family)